MAGDSLKARRLEALDTLVVSKYRPGFDRACVDEFSALLRKISGGEFSALKYLAFDFAHGGEAAGPAAEGFDDLVSSLGELILGAPVITIAWSRAFMSGADFDFALSCSMLVAEPGSRFCFEADLASSLGFYASLARKIGCVKAERLMDAGAVLGPDEMTALMLAKKAAEENAGMAGIEKYVGQCSRRYNASYNIFRAQRIAMPPVMRQIPEARRGAA